MKQLQPFHIVDSSYWPFVIPIEIFDFIMSIINLTRNSSTKPCFAILSLLLLRCGLWFRDIGREATFQGIHTKKVKKGLTYAIILFIISELRVFGRLFWALFHFSLRPPITGGIIWPPTGITILNPLEVPLLNTLILILSGISVTIGHFKVLAAKARRWWIWLTVFLGGWFVYLQYSEYNLAPFTIRDRVYGSSFYILTGCHGFHVIIGTIFLLRQALRLDLYQITRTSHLGLTFAIWYWHFVDVIWLALYIRVYWFGS